MIKITSKIGTLKNIPTIPQILPIKDKKIINAIGLIFNVLPIKFVSKNFQ